MLDKGIKFKSSKAIWSIKHEFHGKEEHEHFSLFLEHKIAFLFFYQILFLPFS